MLNRDSPTIAPRASDRQYGANRPENAGHEVDAAVVLDLPGQRLALGGAGDDAELVAQPLDGRAGDRDRALQRVDRRGVAELVADRGQQAGLRPDQLGAGVEQHEVAGAVGVLRLAGREADLPDGGRLLVAEVAGQRHLAAERAVRPRLAVVRGPTTAGSRAASAAGCRRTTEQLVVPVQRLQVHQHGPAGVGDVGDVHAAVRAAGEVPQHPGVGVAEDGVAALGGLATPSTFSRIHWILPPEK